VTVTENQRKWQIPPVKALGDGINKDLTSAFCDRQVLKNAFS
jgi:hypothetical protein